MQQAIGKSNFGASSCAASSYETIGKVPFPGFLFCIKLLGSPTLDFGGLFLVTSSLESCICSVFLRNIFLGKSWDSVFFWQQSIGESPFVGMFFCSKLLGKSPFGPSVVSSCWGISTCLAGLLLHRSSSGIPNCLRFVRSYSKISIANCCFASSY